MNQPPNAESKRSNFLACFSTLALVLLIGTGLLMVSFRFGFGALILGGVLFSVAAFHYFVWGKWLGAMLRAEQQAAQRREHEENDGT